jgi:hypothetical protein
MVQLAAHLLPRPTHRHSGRTVTIKIHFSIAADDITESKFSLSDSSLDASGEVPIPGTVGHQFQASDFVPKKLLRK